MPAFGYLFSISPIEIHLVFFFFLGDKNIIFVIELLFRFNSSVEISLTLVHIFSPFHMDGKFNNQVAGNGMGLVSLTLVLGRTTG